jgi:hypothetical protein
VAQPARPAQATQDMTVRMSGSMNRMESVDRKR